MYAIFALTNVVYFLTCPFPRRQSTANAKCDDIMEHEEGAEDMPTLSPFRKSSQKRKVTTPRRELPVPVEDDFDVGSLLHSPAKTTSMEQEEKEDKKKKSQRPPMPHDVVEEEEEEKEEHVKEDASRREEKKKKPTDGKKKPPKSPAEDTPKKFGGWFKGTSEHEECVPVHKTDSAAKKSKKKAVVDDEGNQHPLAEVENLYPPKVTSSRIVPRKVLNDDGDEQEDEEESTTSTAAAAAPARKKGTKRARSPVPSSSSPSAQAMKKGARITRPGTCIRVDWAHLPIRDWGERPNATTIARDGLRLSWSPKCSLLTYAMTQFMPFCIPQTPSSRGVISCLSNMIFQDKMRDPRTEKKCFLNLLLEDVAASAPTPILEFKLRLNNITSGTPSNVPVRYHGTQELDLTTMVGLLSLVQLCADPSIGRTADTTKTQPTVTATASSSSSSSDVATEETHQEKRRRRSAATADGEKRKRPNQQPHRRAPVDDEKEEKVHKEEEEEEEGSSDAGGSGSSSSSSSDDDDDSAEREKERRMSHHHHHHHHQHNQRHTDTDGDE